ncbi:MAG TPA: hydroxymethylbilane synthase [Conexibacter sp.]|nr:hydroxymethylbilane synthase [Conexibacter sp.]
MRIGSRGSALALAQANFVAELLGGGDAGVEVVAIATSGDRGVLLGDKSRWVKELEAALAAGEVDAAVHSAKDVPTELPDGFALAAVPERVDPRDALCGAASLEQLPDGARVGTSSLRRAAGLRALRPDLDVVALHGNVDTRLWKLEKEGGELGLRAIVLAQAGLDRLGRRPTVGCVLDEIVPAPGQGTLVVEIRAGDTATRERVSAIDDPHVGACLEAERALARALGASCNTPLGAHAELAEDGAMTLRAFLGLPDGSAWLRDALTDPLGASPEALGAEVAQRMRAAGADELLAACERLAGDNGAPPPASTPEGTRL